VIPAATSITPGQNDHAADGHVDIAEAAKGLSLPHRLING
jgi:hypothetical protein